MMKDIEKSIALGIEVEIKVESEANNIDCNEKPDPQGNAQRKIFKVANPFRFLN